MIGIVRSRYSIVQILLLFIFPCLLTFKIVSLAKKDRWTHTVDRTEKDSDGRIFYYYKSEQKPLLTTKDYFFFLFIGGFSLYFIWLLFKNAPRVTVSDAFIDIKWLLRAPMTINRDSVEKIELTGKQFFPVLWIGQATEATSIYLNDGSKIIIWDFYYRNSSAIKSALNSFHEGREIVVPGDITASAVTDRIKIFSDDGLQKYAGNPFTSFNTLLFAGLIIFLCVIPNYNSGRNLNLLIMIAFMSVLFFFFFGFQMYYFLLSGSRLVIKNHYWPWVNQVYPLDSIEELVFESPHKRSNALRVIAKNYKSRLYSAGSLRDKDWRSFKEDIIHLKLKLRNELFI